MSARGGSRRRLSVELEHEVEVEVQDRADVIRERKSVLDAMWKITEEMRAEILEAVSKEVARKRA